MNPASGGSPPRASSATLKCQGDQRISRDAPFRSSIVNGPCFSLADDTEHTAMRRPPERPVPSSCMGEQVEEPAGRAIQHLELNGRDSKSEQHIADMAEAGKRQQAFDLRLAQRHQVADQHIQGAETQQDRTPDIGRHCASGAKRAQQRDQAGFDHHAGEHGADPAGSLRVRIRQPGVQRNQRGFHPKADDEQEPRLPAASAAWRLHA